jgi:putative sigma-54 modulation protein
MAQLQFTGHNIEITPILRDFIANKFKKLNRHAGHITSTHIILNVEKLRQIAEAKLHIAGAEIYAQTESEDMYKSIDLLVDKLVRQLKKHKDKSGEYR